ncbi:uncharacterized protein LOC110025789 [Phalaenopsis equestris]|uniref:uncharacterized protein LOC110025789 n=1 Tax=Phalaenopsis equestris TaxID=78828 RepID=UPI0009E275C5|nr:uncharacterized protein LOC110025789 [Phalaenopsis equestris]
MSLVLSVMKNKTGPTMGLNQHKSGLPFFIHSEKKDQSDVEAEASSQSSSIGVLSSSSSIHEDERGDEVQSKLKNEGLFATLTSLEETLPIKRGLSKFFSGKSRSFASLAEATSCNATDLVKPENPFNKRRRVLVSCKASWRGRAPCTSLVTSFSPFLCPGFVKEDEVENEEEEVEQEWGTGFPFAPIPTLRNRLRKPRTHFFSDVQKL